MKKKDISDDGQQSQPNLEDDMEQLGQLFSKM